MLQPGIYFILSVQDGAFNTKRDRKCLKETGGERRRYSHNCWFSHDVTKSQTTKLSILLRFYFHGVLEQLKTNFRSNFRFKRVLGFVIEYA